MGGRIKPDAVLYEKPLGSGVMEQAIRFLRGGPAARGGTSLSVYPAAGLLRYFGGAHPALINPDDAPMGSAADLAIRDRVGVLGSLRSLPLALEKVPCRKGPLQTRISFAGGFGIGYAQMLSLSKYGRTHLFQPPFSPGPASVES